MPQQARPARPGIPLGFGALIGLLAVGAALASGQLVAALLSPVSSPFLAVGNAVINYSPEPITEFAKIYLGTNDKPILLSGMAVVIAVVAVVAGLLSRRRQGPGVTVVAALGAAGLIAVVLSPVFSPVDLGAPVVSVVVGLLVFVGLRRLAVRAYGPGAPVTTAVDGSPDVGDDVSRRTVLIGSSVAIGVASLAAGGGGLLLGGSQGASGSRNEVTAQLRAATLTERAPAVPADAAFPDLDTPTFITSNPDFYRIDVALQIPSQTAKDWRLRIHGMVDREITLTFDDLLRRPLVERTLTLTCVSNPVGGNLISTANFIGVELRPILLEAGVQPGAEQLHTTSIDGWTAGTPTDVVMEPDRGALLAIGMNGEALPARARLPGPDDRARPLRLRVGHQVDRGHERHDVRGAAGLLAAAGLVAGSADQDRVPHRPAPGIRVHCPRGRSPARASRGPSPSASARSRSAWTADPGRARSWPPA